MSVQFKLVQQGGQTRRLSFQERPTWLALATKIESLFGIPAENVAVSYIDNDDDEVTLSSHEELHDFYTTGAFHDHDVNKFTVKDLNAIRSSVRTPPTSVPGHSAQDSLLGERIENLAMPSFLMQEDEDWQTIPGLPGVFGGMAPKSPGRAMTPPFVEVVESEEGTAKRSATVSESGAEDDDQTNDASLYTTEDKGKGRAKDPKAASVEDDVSSTGSEIGGEQAPKPPVHIVDHNSSVHGSPQLVRLAEPQTVHMETDALPPNVPILENRRPQSPFNVDDWKPPAPQKPLSPAETVKPFPSFVAWSVEQPSQPTAPTAEPRNVETPAQEQQQPPERARDLDSPRSRQPAWGWRLDYADAETVHHPAPPSRGLFGPPTPPPVGTWSAGPPFVPPFPPRTAQAVPEQAPAAPAPAATTQASAQQPSLINDVAALLSGLTDAFASHPELSEGLRNIIRNAAEGTYWANEREQVMSSARQAAQAMHGPVEAQAEAGRKVAEALGSVFRALGSAASPPAAPRPPLGPRITRVSPSTAAQTDATPASLRNSRAIDFARESDDFTQIPGAWGSSAEPPRRKPYDPTANWHSGWSGRPGPSARDRWPPAPRWYGPPVAEARRFGQDVDPNDWPSSSSVGHGHHSHGPHGPRKHNHRHHIPPPPPPPPMFHNDPFFGHMPPPPPPPGPHGPFPPPPMPPPPPGMLGRPHVPGAPPVPGAGRPAPIIPSPASSRSVSPAPIPGAMPSSSTVRNNQEVVERPAEGGDVDMIEGNGEKDPYERARQRKVQLELAKEKYKQEKEAFRAEKERVRREREDRRRERLEKLQERQKALLDASSKRKPTLTEQRTIEIPSISSILPKLPPLPTFLPPTEQFPGAAEPYTSPFTHTTFGSAPRRWKSTGAMNAFSGAGPSTSFSAFGRHMNTAERGANMTDYLDESRTFTDVLRRLNDMGFTEDSNPRLRQIVSDRVSPNHNGNEDERKGTEQIVADVLEELIGGSVGGNNNATTKSNAEAGASGMSGRRSPDLW